MSTIDTNEPKVATHLGNLRQPSFADRVIGGLSNPVVKFDRECLLRYEEAANWGDDQRTVDREVAKFILFGETLAKFAEDLPGRTLTEELAIAYIAGFTRASREWSSKFTNFADSILEDRRAQDQEDLEVL